MTRYRNPLIICLLSVFCFVCQGQEKPTDICEDVFFNLTMSGVKDKKNSQYYPLTLIIDNQSQDSLRIENFNKYIFHKLDHSQNDKTFYWEFFTTSDQVPDDIVIVTGGVPDDQPCGEVMEIVVPPNSTFVTDIYIRFSSFIRYGKGYFKLCLYYKKCNGCIAELVIKNE